MIVFLVSAAMFLAVSRGIQCYTRLSMLPVLHHNIASYILCTPKPYFIMPMCLLNWTAFVSYILHTLSNYRLATVERNATTILDNSVLEITYLRFVATTKRTVELLFSSAARCFISCNNY
jgi:hypothetical protein